MRYVLALSVEEEERRSLSENGPQCSFWVVGTVQNRTKRDRVRPPSRRRRIELLVARPERQDLRSRSRGGSGVYLGYDVTGGITGLGSALSWCVTVVCVIMNIAY